MNIKKKYIHDILNTKYISNGSRLEAPTVPLNGWIRYRSNVERYRIHVGLIKYTTYTHHYMT